MVAEEPGEWLLLFYHQEVVERYYSLDRVAGQSLELYSLLQAERRARSADR